MKKFSLLLFFVSPELKTMLFTCKTTTLPLSYNPVPFCSIILILIESFRKLTIQILPLRSHLCHHASWKFHSVKYFSFITLILSTVLNFTIQFEQSSLKFQKALFLKLHIEIYLRSCTHTNIYIILCSFC